MKRLNELLENQGGSYILPFLWMHGEPHDLILEELNKIEACQIREICIESRPHPDFCQTGWWEDLDFIMDEARKRNWRVWVLDDNKFPTGHANGAFEKKYPELSKQYLAERHVDIMGPAREGAVLIEPFLGSDGRLLRVLAAPKPDTETLDVRWDGILDLTENVTDGVVYFDLPPGPYRLFVLFTTRKGGGRADYMNLIDRRSVRVLIDEVYESHYARYGQDFGTVFAGFFSDEPEFGNTPGYDFHDMLGKRDVKLPWSDELEKKLENIWGKDFYKNLPALWYGMEDKTMVVRTMYMETVTLLMADCFSGQIGRWCEAHGVEYIGHIIEDDNAHTRLGCSIGHYFREQKGQHMSGIDVVHHQIIPGFTGRIHQWIAGDSDGEFFHFGLAKLGTSAAHLDKNKKGRALCEIFGNYGWAEGVSFMRWLTDHMLVRGINRFVPHAFSPLFPDRDCPPHFYARDNNPQFSYFAMLMKYMNNLCHLTNGGIHRADALVLYHGEAEWSSGETMLFQKPVRALMEAQLDCDVIPVDRLADTAEITGHKIKVNHETYGSLIIPYCCHIPPGAVEFITSACEKEVDIYILNGLPESDTMGNPLPDGFCRAVTITDLEHLADEIRDKQQMEISVDRREQDLRFYCYEQADSIIYLFFNEAVGRKVSAEITFCRNGIELLTQYDAMRNTTEEVGLKGSRLLLELEPGEMVVYIAEPGKRAEGEGLTKTRNHVRKISIDCDFKLWAKAIDETEFQERMILKAASRLPNLSRLPKFRRFVGTYRYEGEFILGNMDSERAEIYFPESDDCISVTINGEAAGVIIGGRRRLDVTDLLKEGRNTLMVDVANTLVWKMRDGASTHMQLFAPGLLEIPVLEFTGGKRRG